MKSVLSKRKLRAQRIFNTYIRLRDCIETSGTPFFAICFTCKKETTDNGDLQASHFNLDSKNGNSTSFDERNVHGCCKRCNRYLNGNLGNYATEIVKKYGQAELERLQSLKLISKKWTINELDQIHDEYKLKLKKLYDHSFVQVMSD